jgi:NAD(P)-dependent dehydrogenase (short-subunit alcohol dehydrogenase family)
VQNFLGPFTLSLLLAETLNTNGPSRIINVSSGTASWSTGIDLGNLNAEKSFHRWWAYCDTKLMMTTISLEMSRRFADRGFKNLTVTVGHPGVRQSPSFKKSNF